MEGTETDKLLPALSVDELLGINDGAQRPKRGPKSQLERQLKPLPPYRATSNRRSSPSLKL